MRVPDRGKRRSLLSTPPREEGLVVKAVAVREEGRQAGWTRTVPLLRAFLTCAAGILAGLSFPEHITPGSAACTILTAAVVLLCPICLPAVRRRMPDGTLLFLMACACCITTIGRRPVRPALLVRCEESVVIVLQCSEIRLFEPAGSGAMIEGSILRAFDSGGRDLPGWRGAPASLRLGGPYGPRPGEVCAFRVRFCGTRLYENGALTGERRRSGVPDRLRFTGHVRDMVVLEAAGPAPSVFDPARLRLFLSEGLADTLSPRSAAFLEAILLGRRSRLPLEMRERLRLAGGYHVLAISGLHIGFLTLLILAVAGAIGLSRRAAALFCMCFLSVYAAIVGAGPSSLRACIMVCVYLGAYLVQRFRSPTNALVAAAFFILLFRPEELGKPGFLLSFSAVFSLLLIPDHGGEEDRSSRHSALRPLVYCLRIIRASAVVFLGQVPVMIHFFGTLYPVSMISNMVIIPLLGLILGIGFLFLIVLHAASVLAGFVAPVVELSVSLLFEAAELFSRVPPLPLESRYLSALSIISSSLLLSIRSRRMTKTALTLMLLLGMISVRETLPPIRDRGGDPGIAFLDVGNGDCAVIHGSGGECIVVDTGVTAGDRWPGQLERYLASKDVHRVDLLILTHPHDDHIGDARRILDAFRVGAVAGTRAPWPSQRYAEVLETVRDRAIPHYVAGEGDTVLVGELSLVFFHPPDTFDCLPGENDYSLVFRLETGSAGILFTGDAETCSERMMIRRWDRALESDVLKTGHHGSRSSTSGRFLDMVRPRTAVISCGREGRFNHPSPEIVERLRERGVGVLRTDLDGGILVVASEPIRTTVSIPDGTAPGDAVIDR